MADRELPEIRLAKNQAMLREVNSRLVPLSEAIDPYLDRFAFLCECAQLDCIVRIQLTRAEYEAVRRHPRRFFVAPANEHVFPEAEAVVERHSHYWVVEKVGQAGEVVAAIAGDG